MSHWIAKTLLKLFGWRTEGQTPAIPKYVLIVAPHTSNWDMPVMLLLASAMRIKATWMGKHTLFRRPFGWLLRQLGGIPINRTARHNAVDQAVEAFRSSERLALGVLPEGTRKRTPHWRSGFYYIALGAGVPIVLGFADYKRKVGGIGPTIVPTGDIEADMQHIRAFYTGVSGKKPEQFGEIQVRSQ
jgi:1-acyl-sn-glycerol-3-phosphate acyltransferase